MKLASLLSWAPKGGRPSPDGAEVKPELEAQASCATLDDWAVAEACAPAAGLAFWGNPAAPAPALPPSLADPTPVDLSYVCAMARNPQLQALARGHNLSVADVAWEDMSRYKFSCVGRNITDTTLRAVGYDKRCSIIRSDNFSDHTADFDINRFMVKVGNETDSVLREESLRVYINRMFGAQGWRSGPVPKTQEVLVSAQTCVLPLKDGKVEFNPEMFNYQSRAGNAACLTIVCCAEGTSSLQLSRYGVQPLYFSRGNTGHNFVAERLKAVGAREGRPMEGAMNAQEEERNILLVIQVPLLQRAPLPRKVSATRVARDVQTSVTLGATLDIRAKMKDAFKWVALPAANEGASAAKYMERWNSVREKLDARNDLYSDMVGSVVGSKEAQEEADADLAAVCETTPATPAGNPPPYEFETQNVAPEKHPKAVALRGTDHAQLGVAAEVKTKYVKGACIKFDPSAAIRCTIQHYLVTDKPTLLDEDFAAIRATMDRIYAAGKRQGSLVLDSDAHTRATAPKSLWFLRE